MKTNSDPLQLNAIVTPSFNPQCTMEGMGCAYRVLSTLRRHFYKILLLLVIGLIAFTFHLGTPHFLTKYAYFALEKEGNTSLKPETFQLPRNTSYSASEMGRDTTLKVGTFQFPPKTSGKASGREGDADLKVGTVPISPDSSYEAPGTEGNGSRHVERNATCPLVPPGLVGPLTIDLNAPTIAEQEAEHVELKPGGRYKPRDCVARHRVAIVVPYRDREDNLRQLLHHLHPFLQRQQLEYGLFVVEQAEGMEFNKGALINVAFVEALKVFKWDCFVFQDVDLLPMNDLIPYSCPQQPLHMAVEVDYWYWLQHIAEMFFSGISDLIFGGVGALTTEQMLKVNGFSNRFWGHGGEDINFAMRIKHHGYNITQCPVEIGKYTMAKHERAMPNPNGAQELFLGLFQYETDGLNSLRYELKKMEARPLYHWIYVELEREKNEFNTLIDLASKFLSST